jgi:hypothetical protein
VCSFDLDVGSAVVGFAEDFGDGDGDVCVFGTPDVFSWDHESTCCWWYCVLRVLSMSSPLYPLDVVFPYSGDSCSFSESGSSRSNRLASCRAFWFPSCLMFFLCRRICFLSSCLFMLVRPQS